MKLHSVVVVVAVVVVPSQDKILSGTRMATVNLLATFSSWLSVDQLHIPEEQVSL
jgi:hypothetical protein